MNPVHVQQRADAELGAAWRRAEAADVSDTLELRGRPGDYIASDGVLAYWGPTPAEALDALAKALQERSA